MFFRNMTNTAALDLHKNNNLEGSLICIDAANIAGFDFHRLYLESDIILHSLHHVERYTDKNLLKSEYMTISCPDGSWYSAAIAGALNQFYHGKSRYWFQNFKFDRNIYNTLLQLCRKGINV